MNKLQYDDIYTEWVESRNFLSFDDFEEEESYARAIFGLYH